MLYNFLLYVFILNEVYWNNCLVIISSISSNIVYCSHDDDQHKRLKHAVGNCCDIVAMLFELLC
jgi:hypothetical protein